MGSPSAPAEPILLDANLQNGGEFDRRPLDAAKHSFTLTCVDEHPIIVQPKSGRETIAFREGGRRKLILPTEIVPRQYEKASASNSCQNCLRSVVFLSLTSFAFLGWQPISHSVATHMLWLQCLAEFIALIKCRKAEVGAVDVHFTSASHSMARLQSSYQLLIPLFDCAQQNYHLRPYFHLYW